MKEKAIFRMSMCIMHHQDVFCIIHTYTKISTIQTRQDIAFSSAKRIDYYIIITGFTWTALMILTNNNYNKDTGLLMERLPGQSSTRSRFVVIH